MPNFKPLALMVWEENENEGRTTILAAIHNGISNFSLPLLGSRDHSFHSHINYEVNQSSSFSQII